MNKKKKKLFFSILNSSITRIKNIKIYLIFLLGFFFISVTGYAGSWTNDSQIKFDEGVYNNTEFDTDSVKLEGLNNQGDYTSKIFDAGSNSKWENLSWITEIPYGQELPGNEAVETGDFIRGIDMTGNVLLMHMDEDSGDIIDYSGNSNDGTVHGGVTYEASGIFDTALAFDGIDGNVKIPKSASVNVLNDFTISGWVKSSNGGTVYDGGYNYPRGFTIEKGAPGLYFNYGNGSGWICDAPNWCSITTNPGADWNHFAVVKSSTEGVKTYFNGVLANTYSDAKYNAAIAESANTDFHIGKSHSYGRYFEGSTDEFAIFDRTLSDQEIEDSYKRGALTLGLSVQSCDDSICDGESWTDLGDNLTSPQSLTVDDNQFFQYKFDFETDDTNFTPQLHEVEVGYNSSPDAPTNNSPVDLLTNVELNPNLIASAFSDTETNNHIDTEWQIDNDNDFSSPVWTRTAGAAETQTTTNDVNGNFANELLGETHLDYETTYYWQVRYKDDGSNNWSNWSTSTSFTTNSAPTISINSALSKTNGTGTTDISIELDDNDLTDTLSAQIEYKAGVDCSSGTSDPTIDDTLGTYSADSGTPTINNAATYQVSNIPVVDVGSNTVQFDWLSATDVPSADGTYCVRITPYDGTDTGTSADASFTLDNVDPTASGNLTNDSINTDSITYVLGAAGSDTNLDQYSIYYKEGATGVVESDSLHTTIASGAYTPGNTTTINSLSVNTQYTANIWTYDSYGNKSNATELAVYTAANIPGASTIDNPSISTLDIVLDANSNPNTTEFAIQETGSGNYIQADGSLGASAIWQDNATWGTTTVTGLSLNTSYTFQTKARNGDNVETAFGSSDSLYTLAEAPGQPTVSNLTTNSFDVTLGINNNPSGTKYAIQVSDDTNNYYVQADGSLGASEVWQTKAVWGTTTVAGLTAETSYTVRAKARNEDGVETAFDDGTDSGTTEAEEDSDTTPIQRAQTVKTEEDIQLEQSQGIIDDGANIEVGDLTYDGTKEIVTTPRVGAPYVRIYSKEGFILTPPFLAYDKSYTNGVNVAIGDLEGTSGEQEIITSPMDGAAHIRIFNKDGQVLNSFFAREDSFRGNSIVKIANLEGPDRDSGDLEIIILFSDGILKVFNKEGQEIMAPIQAFLPHLQNVENTKDILFDLETVDIENNNGFKEVVVSDHNTIMIYGKDPETKKLKQIIPDIIPFEPGSIDYNKGIVLSIADLDGTGGEQELIIGSKKGSSIVRVFNKDGKKLKPDFYAYDPGYYGGIDLIASDLDGTDGPVEIVTIAQNYSAHVRIFNKDGQPLTSGFMAYPEGTNGKTKIQAVNLQNDELQGGSQEKDIVVVPIQGPTHARFYSKDSELLMEGFYIVGVGTKVEVE